MLPNDPKEIEDMKNAIKSDFIKEVKRQTVELMLSENAERISRYQAEMRTRLAKEIKEEFPL